MPMAVTETLNHQQNNSSQVDTDGPHTQLDGQQQPSALDILVDNANSSNKYSQ